MLLKKIKTKGFLGHLTGEADNEFVELDFADKNLWLIQGRNGAGKSTLFDAITMAFYKQHRGGGSYFAKLVHDKADRAEIFVEFALHGNDYQITVDLPRKSTVTRSLKVWNGANWATKNDNVDDWVSKNLKIKYETFVSSVLLRQGEADKFITAKPTPRREIFLELLQLEFYKKLTDRAKFRQKCVGDKLKEIRQSLEGLDNPSAVEINKQEKQVKQFSKELENQENQKLVKQKEFDNAEKAQKLKSDIEEIEAQQKLDAALFDNATQVEKTYQYFLELKENLIRFENVWREKNEITHIDDDFEANKEKFNKLNDDFKTVKNNLTKNLSAWETAKSGLLELEKQLTSAMTKRDETRQKIDEILRIENLENQIRLATEELQKSRRNISETKEKLIELRSNIEKKHIEKDELTTELQKTDTDFQIWSDRLENRQNVVDKDECPTCGNELNSEETRLKLVNELEEAKRKVKELKQWKDNLTENFSESKKQLLQVEANHKIEDEKYQNLLQTETGFKTKIETWQLQITTQYTTDERATMRSGFAELHRQVGVFDRQFKVLKEKSEQFGKFVGDLEKSKTQIESNLKNTQDNQDKLQERKQKAVANLVEAENQIFGSWQTHQALQDEKELENLRSEKNALRNIEAEYRTLTDARNRQVILNTKIETFTQQREEIPEIHWRDVSEVQEELNEIIGKIVNSNSQLKQAEEIYRKMTADKKLYDGKSIELKSVKTDFEIWKKLVSSLGKDGLETKIVREAQSKISENANKTLKALSNGNFQLELEDSGKEMKIFVRDFTTGEQRQVEYCSGGEKFLTAVSLAVAIGQSASGQNIANTLIIDEGFGALDDKNRVLMVNELSRLTDIFQNGRVIIVSHQDDVQENFANRYRLSKNDNGLTSVETGTIL